MKQLLFFGISWLAATSAYAQFQVQGTVLNATTSLPIASQSVRVVGDSTGGGLVFTLNTTTNSSGVYTATMPAGVVSGQTVKVWTNDCTNTRVTNTHTYAGVNIASNLSICVYPNTITGMVKTGTAGAPNAIVYLIEKKYDSTGGGTFILSLIDSAFTDPAGNYTAPYPGPGSLRPGNSLLVKAALLPASADYANYLPTYYTSSLSWSGATAVTRPMLVSNTDVSLIGGVNPGGPAFIGGSVLLGANKSTENTPLPSRILLLTDMNDKAIAYKHSDQQGKFAFNSLPYGQYKLFGDAYGKKCDPLIVTVQAGTAKVDNIVFEENKATFTGSFVWPSSIGSIGSEGDVAVFPNPANDIIRIKGLEQETKAVSVLVTDVRGAGVSSHTFVPGAEQVLSVAALPTGMYIIKVTASGGDKVVRFFKQ